MRADAGVRFDFGRAILFLFTAPDQPNSADLVVGVQSPSVTANVTNHRCLRYSLNQIAELRHMLERAAGRRSIAWINQITNRGNTQHGAEHSAKYVRGQFSPIHTVHDVN